LAGIAVAMATPVVAVAMLLLTDCFDCDGFGQPHFMGLCVREVGADWSVEFGPVLPGRFPDTTYVEISDQNGAITLAATSFARLTPAHWDTFHVVYEKVNPSIREIETGDHLVIDGLRYQYGSRLSIRDDANVIGYATLP